MKEKKFRRYRSCGVYATGGSLSFDVYDIVENETTKMTNKEFQELENEMLTEEEYLECMRKHPVDPADIMRECGR